MMLTVSTTDRRDGKALVLFARCADWQVGHTKDGRSFFAIPGSEVGLFHMTDQRDCSCQDRQQRQSVCKHIRAVRLWMAAFKTGAVAPKREPSADVADDLVILTPEGAAYLAEQSEPVSLMSYRDLYPGCAAGCGDLVERRGERCDRCSRTEVRRLDAESRAAVFATIAPFTLNEQEV